MSFLSNNIQNEIIENTYSQRKSNENVIVKRNIKDCVFTDLFSNKKYLRELYLSLHPEDSYITEDDLTDITIENVLVNNLYNDLGFRVGNRLIILVEAQSTWSPNILIRSLIYVTTTYQKYINEKNLDVYSSKKIDIPKPELYVVYTGDRKERPAEMQLSKEFFPDSKNISLDVKVNMIYGDTSDDIISQYVLFTKVYDEQRKLYGRTRQAIEETIHICKEKDVLKEYLESRETEVVTMMMTLFDEEQISKNHEASIRREEREQANVNFVLNMHKKGFDVECIAEMVELSTEEVNEIIEKNNDLALV